MNGVGLVVKYFVAIEVPRVRFPDTVVLYLIILLPLFDATLSPVVAFVSRS